jgi:cytochrome P450
VTDERPSFSFDHTSPEFAADPWSTYARLRRECPVAWTESHGGFWVLAGYDDVYEVARDDETFSSDREVVIPPTRVGKLVPLNSDPPALQVYRRILLPFFSLQYVERTLAPRIRDLVDVHLDRILATERFDLVRSFALPIPAMTTHALLGLPLDEWEASVRPVEAISTSRAGTPEQARAVRLVGELRARLADEAERRRTDPREDLLTHLTQARFEDRPLRPDEIADMATLVVFAGMDTTTAAVSNALLYLHHDLEARARLIAEPALLENAIEEFLRYEPPVQGFARTVTRDCVVGGQSIPAGETIFMLWGSANRDEAVFAQPDEVVLDRFPNRHLAFGVGAHRCLGANIARAEIRIMLGEVLARLPDYRILEEEMEARSTAAISFGKLRLPAVRRARTAA